MYTGTIKKLVRNRGFGFISARDGREIFFHQNSLTDVKFDVLEEDQKVEFEVEKTYKGPRAFNIHILKEAE